MATKRIFQFIEIYCPVEHDIVYLYISLTVHHDINQFVITNLMHICFIS
jgi:hypothetical protein